MTGDFAIKAFTIWLILNTCRVLRSVVSSLYFPQGWCKQHMVSVGRWSSTIGVWHMVVGLSGTTGSGPPVGTIRAP